MLTNTTRGEAQVRRVLSWLASGGVAWLCRASFERARIIDGPFVIEVPHTDHARSDALVGGDTLLASDPVVAGLIAQSTRDAPGVERHVALACGGYRVHADYVGGGWTLGALVPAGLDAGQVRARVERATVVLARALAHEASPREPGGGSSGSSGSSGAPAEVGLVPGVGRFPN